MPPAPSSDAYSKAQQKRLKLLLSSPTKDWAAVLAITASILSLQASHYPTLVYHSLALFHLGRLDDAEASYRKAIELDGALPLAWQGLVTVYEKREDWEKVQGGVEQLVGIFRAQGDSAKEAAQLEKLLELLEKHDGEPAKITATLEALSTHPSVPYALPYLLKLRALHSSSLSSAIAKETAKRRQRLTGPVLTAAETLAQVESEYLPSSPLPTVLQRILDDPDAGSREDLRREVEGELLDFEVRLVKVSPPERKDKARADAMELARGMCVVRSAVVSAWEIELDWRDGAQWEEEGAWETAEVFLALFPDHLLAQILRATLRPPEDDEVEDSLIPEEEDELPLDLLPLQDSPLSHVLLCTHFYRFKDWETLLSLAKGGLESLERLEAAIGLQLPVRTRLLQRYLALAFTYTSPPSHHASAIPLVESLLSHPDPDLLTAHAVLLSAASNWELAIDAWTLVGKDGEAERAWALVMAGRKEEGREALVRVLESWKEEKEREEGVEEGKLGVLEGGEVERARVWWRYGKVLWDLGESDPALNLSAFNAFQTSILHSPTFAPSYTSLGLYYSLVKPPEPGLASDCFLRAFEIDSAQLVAARYLAEQFADDGDWGMVESVARRCVGALKDERGRMGEEVSWAWKAIGGSELNSRRYPESIAAFQYALRGAPLEASTWIRLGVAYRKSGKHVAALKVFKRATQLAPDSWYAEFGIGEVQRELGLLDVAIEGFNKVIRMGGGLGVKVVRAETLLEVGRERMQKAFLVRGEEAFIASLEQIVDIFSTAFAPTTTTKASEAPRAVWKITAEALAGLAGILKPSFWDRSRTLALNILSEIERYGVDGKIKGIDSLRSDLVRARVQEADENELQLWLFEAVAGLACKLRVLLETQNDVAIGAAWHDLGLALSRFRPHLPLLLSPSAPTDDDLLHEAIRCIKYALHKEPVNSGFWNALGVLAFDLSPRLAQHAFIKAIEYSSRSAVAWTNLGLFYIAQGDDDLANEALLKAQVLNPDWGPAWVGQSTLANSAGHIEEAAVLLEHAFVLGGTPEADLGYAESAFEKYRHTMTATNTPSATEKSLAPITLSAPLFAITRYLTHKPSDSSALHLSALLLERLGDLKTATATLEQVGQLLSDEYEADESPESEARFIVSQTNLGRVRLANEDPEGALGAFEAAVSLLPEPRTGTGIEGGLSFEEVVLLYTECKVGSSLALFWSGDVGGAIEQLSEALDEIENVEGAKKAALAILQSRIYWSEHDEDRALGSVLDAPDVSNVNSPLFVKLTLHALAIVTDDYAILDLLYRISRQPSVKYNLDYTRLRVSFHLIHGDQRKALDSLANTIHAAPWDHSNRRALSWLLLEMSPVPNALNPTVNDNLEICSRFLRTGHVAIDAPAELRTLRMIGAGVVAIGSGHEGAEEEGRILQEKGTHLAPWLPRGWRHIDLLTKAMA